MNSKPIGVFSYISAWLVHLLTASGVVFGFLACLAIINQQWVNAMLWLLTAVVIDGIDGTLARKLKIKEVLPNVDGKMLDYVIDFVNFVFVPTLFIYCAVNLHETLKLLLVSFILIASSYHYSNLKAVENNQFFVGFPAVWNIVAFYLFVLDLSQSWNALVIVTITILHFIPIKFLYLSRFFITTYFAAPFVLAWVGSMLIIILSYPDIEFAWVVISLSMAFFFILFSNLSLAKICIDNYLKED